VDVRVGRPRTRTCGPRLRRADSGRTCIPAQRGEPAHPSLRERLDDILPLARFFLDRYAVDFKKKVSGFSPDAIEKIRRYSWPGNVRELQNAIRAGRASLRRGNGRRPQPDPGGAYRWEEISAGNTMNLEELERGTIERALRLSRGVQKEAAKLMGVTPRVLNYKISEMKID